MAVDGGGGGLVAGMLLGFAVDGAVMATTGKSAGEWVGCGLTAVGGAITSSGSKKLASGKVHKR